jgi:uncharacterized membrane protein YhaH (DUF805 family)
MISETALACPKCGAPPRVFLGAALACAECGASFHAAWNSCRNCGAPRDVAASVTTGTVHHPAIDARATNGKAAGTTDRDVFTPDLLRTTTGRVNRQAFLVAFLVVFLLIVSLFVLLSLSDALPTDRLTRVLIVAGAMMLLLPSTIERLHDIGWSGWLAPVMFLPGGFLLLLLLAILPGMKGPNQHGPPPTRTP